MPALFAFTIRRMMFEKKIFFTIFLLALPAGIATLIRSVEPANNLRDLWQIYHIPINFLLYMMIIPLVCLLHGSALIGSEADSGTLTYLITRKMRRATVLLVKFAAAALVITLLVELALLAQYAAALYGIDLESLPARDIEAWQPIDELWTYMSVAPLAVSAYLAIFVVIGLVVSRPLIASMLYVVIVEMFLANLPVGIRVYSVAHHIRVAFLKGIPRLERLYNEMTEVTEGTLETTWIGITTLSGIALVALVVACILMSTRELIAHKVTRE